MKPMTAFGIVIGFLSLSALSFQVGFAKPAVAMSAQDKQTYAPVIDPNNFVTGVDNPYFPLKPGTTLIYEGKIDAGFEHEEVVVSADTKVIMGVTCVTVIDTVTIDGKLKEATVDWYAQDKQGNVWYFGEDSKDYENGKVVSTKGSWLAGVNGAYPGYIMKAQPKVGETYRQEYYKGEAEDWANVVSLNRSAIVPTGSYKNVWMTKDWAGLDNPPAFENKYYAKGIGLVMITGGTGKGWKVSLIEIRRK